MRSRLFFSPLYVSTALCTSIVLVSPTWAMNQHSQDYSDPVIREKVRMNNSKLSPPKNEIKEDKNIRRDSTGDVKLRFIEKIEDPLEVKNSDSIPFSEFDISGNNLLTSSQPLSSSSLPLDSSVLPPLMKHELETLNQKILTIMEAELDVYEQAKRELEEHQKKELQEDTQLQELLEYLLPPEEILIHQKHILELNVPQSPQDDNLKAIHRNIERIETFIKDHTTYPRNTLLAVQKSYQAFLENICTKDLKKRTDLLTERARLRTEGGIPYLVPVSLAREIIAKDVWNKKIETNQEGGQSTVVGKEGVHFKDGAASVNGLKPPYEWAVYSFAQLLLGQDYTPPTTTFCLEKVPYWFLKKEYEGTEEGKRVKNRLNEKVFFSQTPSTLKEYFDEHPLDYKKLETHEKSSYIQASRSSGTLSLLEFFQNQKGGRQKQLNICSYSGFFFLSLLLNFTDAKDDNLRLMPGNKLISIDNDRVFGNMIVADKNGNQYIEAKNVLFLMKNELNKPIDDYIVKKILALDGDVLFLEWLKACAYQNQQYEALYKNSILPEGCEQLLIQLQPKTVLQVKERLETLCRILKEAQHQKKKLTHGDVLRAFHPLAYAYFTTLNQKYADPHEAQQKLWKGPSLKEVLQNQDIEKDFPKECPRPGDYEEGRTDLPQQEASLRICRIC